MALEALPERRCSTCNPDKQAQFGCDTDMKRPLLFDGEYLHRCPLRPYKDDPTFYSELFTMYAFMDKGVMAEGGAFFDQPNVYIEAMMELRGAISDSYSVKDQVKEQKEAENKQKIDKLSELGFNITKK